MPRGHDYSVIADTPNPRIAIYARLGIISIVVSALLRNVGNHVSHTLAVRLSIPDNRLTWVGSLVTSASSVLIFGALLALFRRFFWRMWFVAPLYWFTGATRPPCLRGIYQASIAMNTPYEDTASRRMVKSIVEIVQDWDKMMVAFEVIEDSQTPWVRSTSDMALMRMGLDPARVTLQYTYQYETTARGLDDTRGALQTIRGSCVMMFVRTRNRWRAHGHYYTEDSGSGTLTFSGLEVGGAPPATAAATPTPGWRRRRLWGLRALPYGRSARGRSQPGPQEQS